MKRNEIAEGLGLGVRVSSKRHRKIQKRINAELGERRLPTVSLYRDKNGNISYSFKLRKGTPPMAYHATATLVGPIVKKHLEEQSK